jgi:hypothetical protein
MAMTKPLDTAVAFESAFPHEIELVLNALSEAGLSAAKAGQSNLGQVHFLAGAELTPEGFWFVVVPVEQLVTARSIVATLPVTRRDQPLASMTEAEIQRGSMWLFLGAAAASLLAAFVFLAALYIGSR